LFEAAFAESMVAASDAGNLVARYSFQAYIACLLGTGPLLQPASKTHSMLCQAVIKF